MPPTALPHTPLLTSMTQVFEIYDADKSGELDRTEMAQALKQFRSPEYHQAFAAIGLDLDMIQAMLKHADADMNGKVNHEVCLQPQAVAG